MSTSFFRLDEPKYATDHESDRRNTVWVGRPFVRLPAVTCDLCGTWGSGKKLRVPVPQALIAELGTFPGVQEPLPWREWQRRRVEWAAALHVEPEVLEPSTKFGPPHGDVRRKTKEDVIHASPGDVWVQERVKVAIEEAAFTGVQFVEVVLNKKDCPRLWELEVHGHGFQPGYTVESRQACQQCGRDSSSNPRELAVDVLRWDGSDFFDLDGNPNMMIVTERVRDLFVRERFSNCAFYPVPQADGST